MQAANSECDQATDVGYTLLLQGHLYKPRSAGPPNLDRQLYFYDEKGAQVTDPAILSQLVSAVWTHDNVIASADARGGSNRVAAILGTSKALGTYTPVQDEVARAIVEAMEAAATRGVSLAKAIPNLSIGVLKAQLLNLPKTLLALSAQRGLEASLAAYRRMDQIPLPPPDATALNVSDLARIKDVFVQARTLELPNTALAARLMPTSGSELRDQALRSALSEITSRPLFSGSQTATVTLLNLLALQKSLANMEKSLPALQAYSENLNLAINLEAATNKMISQRSVSTPLRHVA